MARSAVVISARSVITARAPSLAQGVGFAGLVGVADDGDAAGQAREDVGHAAADEHAVPGLGPQAADCDADPVGRGFHEGRVGIIPADDLPDARVQVVLDEVGGHGGLGVVRHDGDGAPVRVAVVMRSADPGAGRAVRAAWTSSATAWQRGSATQGSGSLSTTLRW
jgi:hypothetical protein